MRLFNFAHLCKWIGVRACVQHGAGGGIFAVARP